MGCASSAEHPPSTGEGDAAAAPGYDASTPFHPDPALEFAGEVEIPSPAVSELPAAAREQPHSTPPLPVRVRNPFDSLDTLQASTDVMLHTQGSVPPPPPAVNDAYAFSAAAVSQAGGPLCASREGPPGQRDLWAEQELDAAANWRGASPAITMSEFSPQLHTKRVEGRACMARLHGYTRDVDQFPAPPPLTREAQRAIAFKCLAWLGALDTTAFGGAPPSLTDPSLVSDSGSGYGALPATHA